MADKKDYINLSVDELEDFIKKEFKDSLFSYPISMMKVRAGIYLDTLEDGSLYLDTLNIRPELQGKGVGSEILGILKEWATSNGVAVYIKPAYLSDNPYFKGVELSPEEQVDNLFNFYKKNGWKDNPNFTALSEQEQAAQLSLSANIEWGVETNDIYSPLVFIPEGVEVPELPKNPYLDNMISFAEKFNKEGKAFLDGYNQPILDEVLEEILKLEMYFGVSGFMEESEWKKSKLYDVAIELDNQGIHPNDVGDISDYIPRDKILTPAQIFKEGKRNEFFTDGIVKLLSEAGGSFYKLNEDGDELFPENKPKRDYELYYAISGKDEAENIERVSSYKKKHHSVIEGPPKSLKWIEYTSKGDRPIPSINTPTNVKNVKNLTDQQLYDEFVKYSKITLEAEKFGDLTPELLNIQQTQDWETFSRARGYTEQEISDFKRYLDLSAEMENRFPGKDGFASLAEGINYELQHEDSITTLEEWKKFTSTDTPTNVVDDVTDFQNTLRNKYSNVIADIEIGGVKQPTLSLEPISGQNSFVIKNLYIDDTLQGQGYGTQIMNDIIEFADNNNLQVELDISATNKSLAKYYERFGFVLSDETNRDMIRKPNTPTNVVDDKPTLNTDLVWETDRIQADGNPRWNDNIVPNNNILKPNLKNDDIKRIIPQILDGTVSDIDFTRFGIWLLHKSPVPAFGTKPFRSVDAIADVVKIVIFNGKSPIDLINEDTLDMLKNWIISDTGPFTVDKATGPNAGKSSIGLTDELILQFGREEGPFANAQQRMKQTIINEHNKLYADADDYFILFRGGALTNDPIQSFSKNGRQAYFIGHHMNQETIRQGGRGVDGYIVNKYDFIDLQSLGLDYGSEAEVIAYREGVNKPFQKTVMDESVRNFNYLDKNRLKFIDDNWIMISDEFPKTGFINSVDPTNPTRNQTLRVMEDSPDITNASTRVQQVAIDFAKTYGLAEPNFNAIAYFNPEVGVQAADIYQGLPDFDDNAVPLYNKFIKETNLQYDALNNAGLQFELVDTDPYTPNAAGHQQMINDMQNGRLKVLATSAAGEIPQGSPMAQQSGYVDVNGRPMLNNDVFRAVHDTFGHGMRGNTFGPVGEYNAWLAHKEMYSTTAQRVMTTETLGQNTWVNFGPHMRTEDGVLIGKGDSGYIGPADRPFAPQKVAVMPEDIITNAGNVVDNASELVSPGAMNKVQQFISNTPDAAEQLWKATKFTMGKAFRGLQVFDPGDIIIEAGLARLLPRLGLAAIAVPTLYAYVFYELAVLAVDAANGLQKAAEKQGVAEFGDGKDIDWKQLGKDTWSEMGEVSDTWSLSWKISEPIINKVFEEYGKMKTAKDEKDYFTNLDVGVAAR